MFIIYVIDLSIKKNKKIKNTDHWKYRSSRPEVFCKKGVLRNSTKFTGKHLCQCLRPATLLKKRFFYRCFPVGFVKFLRTPFCKEHLWWLLLEIEKKYIFFQLFHFRMFRRSIPLMILMWEHPCQREVMHGFTMSFPFRKLHGFY